MKTAEEFYIERFGGGGYTTRRSPSKANVIAAMNEFAKEVAREALKNASENADTIEIPDAYGSTIDVVDKQSILDESNIPEL